MLTRVIVLALLSNWGYSAMKRGIRILLLITRLGAPGRLAQGVVSGRWVGEKQSKGCKHYLACRFIIRAEGGKREIAFSECNEKAHLNHQPGDPVQVRYLPENPIFCRIETDER